MKKSILFLTIGCVLMSIGVYVVVTWIVGFSGVETGDKNIYPVFFSAGTSWGFALMLVVGRLLEEKD